MNITDRYQDIIERGIRGDYIRRYWLDEDKTAIAYDILATLAGGICKEKAIDLSKYLCALHAVMGQNVRVYLYTRRNKYDEFIPNIEIECFDGGCVIYPESKTSELLAPLIKALTPCEVIY